MNTRDTLDTQLNVLANFNPVVPDSYQDCEFLMLGNLVPAVQNAVIDQMKNDPKMAGKPDEMIGKIAEGKLNAFFKENTLMLQPFVKDSSKTVAQYLESVNNGLTVVEFRRVSVG